MTETVEGTGVGDVALLRSGKAKATIREPTAAGLRESESELQPTARSKLPPRVPVTEKERNRLVKFGAKLGKVLGELVTIVHPDTLRRWIRNRVSPAVGRAAEALLPEGRLRRATSCGEGRRS